MDSWICGIVELVRLREFYVRVGERHTVLISVHGVEPSSRCLVRVREGVSVQDDASVTSQTEHVVDSGTHLASCGVANT